MASPQPDPTMVGRWAFALALAVALCAGTEVFDLHQMESDLLDADASTSRTIEGLKRLALGKNKVTDPIGDLSRELEMEDGERRRVDAMLAHESRSFDHFSDESPTVRRARLIKEESLEKELKADLAQHVSMPDPGTRKSKQRVSRIRAVGSKLGMDNSDKSEDDATDDDDDAAEEDGSSDDDENDDACDGDTPYKDGESCVAECGEGEFGVDGVCTGCDKLANHIDNTCEDACPTGTTANNSTNNCDEESEDETDEGEEQTEVSALDNSLIQKASRVDPDGIPNHRQEGSENPGSDSHEQQVALDEQDHPEAKHYPPSTDSDGTPQHYQDGAKPPERVREPQIANNPPLALKSVTPELKASQETRTKATNNKKVSAFASDWDF